MVLCNSYACVDETGASVAVYGTLSCVQDRGDVITCLVTGNLEPIGWAKMDALGITHLFTKPYFGGFGSDYCNPDNSEQSWKDRAELVKISAQKAHKIFPGTSPGKIQEYWGQEDVIAACTNIPSNSTEIAFCVQDCCRSAMLITALLITHGDAICLVRKCDVFLVQHAQSSCHTSVLHLLTPSPAKRVYAACIMVHAYRKNPKRKGEMHARKESRRGQDKKRRRPECSGAPADFNFG